jgi:hypothetical protein
MKTHVAIISAIQALLFSHFAQASAGWTDYVNVAELVPTGRHYYEVRLPVRKNPSGCRDETWFYRDYSSSGSDKMFDLLFEGVKSGIKVRVYVTGICNLDGYSEISAVSVIR